MTFASNHRFSITAFAIAAVATAALNGTMLVGFNQVASAGEQVRMDTARLENANTRMPTVALQPVVISARRA